MSPVTLHERERPASWSDLVGQDHILKEIELLRQTGLTGRSYWISGPIGTGKTTIARLLAAEVADPILKTEVDFRKVTVGWMEDVERELEFKPLFGKAYAYIVNEAHRLRTDCVTDMLTLLDPVPAHAMFVFTTTTKAQKELFDKKTDSLAFLSRCEEFRTRVSRLEFAVYAQTVAARHNLDGKPIEEYVRLVDKHHGNLRAVLRDIEHGAMLR